jgi:cell division protein FtsQ
MKKWLKITLIAVFAVLSIGLLVMSLAKAKKRILDEPKIVIHVEGGEAFLNRQELFNRIVRLHLFHDKMESSELKIGEIEREIRKMEEVKTVRVFKYLGGKWKIEVELRKPIARIFATSGDSYYLDSEGFTISKSDLHTARVLVFSGHINENLRLQNTQVIINNDSLKNIKKLDDMYRISNYVCTDPILHPLIGQVYLEKDGDFVLIPLIGDQKIVFGTAYSDEQVREKFERLKIFYKEGLPYEGWEKYSEINLKYDGQIVCRKRVGK